MENQRKKLLKNKGLTTLILATTSTLLMSATSATAATIKVTIENLAPEFGTFLTPVWVGFHDGTFDTYDRNVSLDGFPGTESVVEDGATDEISAQFTSFGAGNVQATIPGLEGIPGPIDPGEITSFYFDYEDVRNSGSFFSYISMVIPSNDFFIANGNPLAHQIFDEFGKFIGADILVLGSQVLDGGTEVNDELPANTAFFGQQTPNTGVDENGVVRLASEFGGFLPMGSGGILDDPRFANADFLAENYQVARIKVEKVSTPEPTTSLGLLLFGGLLWGGRRLGQKSNILP